MVDEWAAKHLQRARAQGWTIMQDRAGTGRMIAKVDDEAEPEGDVCLFLL